MRHILLFCFTLLLVLCVSSASAEDAKKEYSIAEFTSAFRPSGIYTLRTYVAATFECPACPAGAECEPCDDFIVLSDKNTGRCATDKFCDYEMLLPVRDANHMAAAKHAGTQQYLTTIDVGGISLREMQSVEVDESIKRMMKKDPALREKNPIKWMQQNYELQDKNLQKKP